MELDAKIALAEALSRFDGRTPVINGEELRICQRPGCIRDADSVLTLGPLRRRLCRPDREQIERLFR